MNLSIESYSLREKVGDKKGIEMIANAGFDAIDYSFYFQTKDVYAPGQDYIKHAYEIRECIEKNGIVCNQAHAPFEFKYGMEMSLDEEKYRNIAHAIEAAAIMGAKNIVVHCVQTPNRHDLLDYNYRFYKSFEPICQKHSINIAIENLFTYNSTTKRIGELLSKPEEISELIDRLGNENFVACLDIGHTALTGIEPQDFIREIDINKLKALHVQDNNYESDSHTVPYHGMLDWDKITLALGEVGYSGDLTFEIIKFIKKYDNELLSEALRHAERTGRHLINKIKAASKAKN